MELINKVLQGETAPEDEPSDMNFRWIKDGIFRSIQSSLRQIDDAGLRLPDIHVPTKIMNDSDQGIDEEQVRVPSRSVIALMSGAELAARWESIPETDRTAEHARIVERLLREGADAQFDPTALARIASWREAFAALLKDAMSREELAMQSLKEGLPSHVLESKGRFIVEAREEVPKQVGLVIQGTLERLYQIYGADREIIEEQISGWEMWKDRLIVPSAEDVPKLVEIANDVRIPYEVYVDLVSPQGEIREAALEHIRRHGGFIHEPDQEEYREMITHGVSRMTDDGTAHFGVITHPDIVLRHMREVCGYEAEQVYRSIDDLPKVSALGWQLDWKEDPNLALSMFQSPLQVAWTVELAVKREEKPASSQTKNGRGRRNAGIGAALKQAAYADPGVEQALILTRYFQILEVSIPEIDRGPVAVSGAVNAASDVFIRYLGGRHIGSATEDCVVKAVDRNGKVHDVALKIRWLLFLAPRKSTLEAIRTPRGQRH